MENTARDYSDSLKEARNNDAQMPNASSSHPGDLHMHGAADNHGGAQSSGSADNYSGEQNHADSLAEARKTVNVNGSLKETVGNVAKAVNPGDATSTLKQMDLITDMPFVAAFGAALLKDLSDLVTGPTVILAILFSILCSIFIFMMLLLVSANDKRGMAKSLIKRGLILVGGGIADSIPGIDFLPIESLTVAVIYYLTLVERKNAEK